MKPIIRKTLKIIGWITISIIFLLVLVFILIQIPAVQNFAKNKIVTYLEDKIKTNVSIGTLSIAFPKRIVLKDVYFEDQRKDTLLAGKELRVDIALLKLLNNEVNVDYLLLNGIRTNIYRIQPDTSFNFDYIVKAFAGEQTKPATEDTAASTLKFRLNRIVLKDIRATFKDDETGNDVYFYLGNFETRIKEFDPDNSVYNISRIAVANITTRIHQYKPFIQNPESTTTTADTSSSSTYPALKLDEIDFRNISFNYRNDISALLADLNIGQFITHPENLNLQTLLIQLRDVQLKNTTAKIVLGKTEQAKAAKDTVATKTKEEVSNPWKIQLAKIDFNNDALSYDDNSKPKAASGVDFNHLHIENFIFNADGLTFTPTEYSGNINQLAFNEQSGLSLRRFQTKFLYNDKQAALQNMLLQTDNSTIRDKIVLSYPSAEALTKNPGEIYVDANLSDASIAVKDVLAFMPAFKRNVKGHETAIIKLNASAKGYVKDLSISNFEMSGYGETYAKFSGKIKGLPDTKKTYYDIKIARISSTKNDIINLLPPNSIPSSVRLPDVFLVTGFFSGSMNEFNTQLALRTNRGDMDVKGTMNSHEVYSAEATLTDIDAGYLLKQDTLMGKITMNATVDGAGLDMKTADISYNVNLVSAQIKGYEYKDLSIKGNANNGIVHTAANINDPNISLNLDATADIKPKYPAVKFDFLIDTINLKALHLVTDTLSMHAHIIADMPGTNPDSLNGTVNINDLVVIQAGQRLNTDSLSLVANSTAEQNSIVINSDALKASLTGKYKLTEFAQALQNTINRYYNLPGFKEKNVAAQNWQFNATIIPTGLLLQLMPSLSGSDSTVIRTTFNSAENDLDLSIKNRLIAFGQQQVDSLNITAQTNADALNYSISMNGIRTPSMHIYQTSLSGSVAKNQLDFALNVRDKKKASQYVLAGLLSQVTNGVKLSLKPDSVVLDYTKWVMGQDNFIQYDSIAGILVKNFTLSNAGQSFSINSTEQTMNAPVRVDFKDFQIGTLTKIANQDSLLVGGVINGNAVITNPTKNPVFTSDLHITNLAYQRDTIGDLAIQVNNQQANAFAANVSLQGNNTDVKLNGMYYTGEGRMDLKLNLNQINLAIVKPFAAGQLNDISGLLKGNINITGTASQPAVNGELHFENASVTPAITGAILRLPNEAIAINSQGIHFNQFTMLDSAGNKAIINGDILTSDFKNYGFNVGFKADHFTLINTPK
ncbi:MAG TPA: translocation/assembly module TamB domain-containing protein, partial [Chitinophagaceae bacterium]